jgi:hypothetical protein
LGALRFWGPRAHSLLFYSEFFVSCFSAGPMQIVRGPQRAQVPQNLKSEAPKSEAPKSEAPKSGAPNGFFLFHVSVFQRGPQTVRQCGAPKSPSPPKFKKRGLKNRNPKRFSPVSARGPNSAGAPKSPRSLEKCQTSKFKNLDTKEHSPKPVFLFPVSARDPNSAWPQRVQGPQRAQVPPKF